MPKRWAIADIHGCPETFKALLGQLHLSKADELYILGDLVNKGPDSIGVLDEIIRLIEQGYKVRPIRGNHDQLALESATSPKVLLPHKPDFEIEELKASFGLNDMSELDPHYLDFINKLPYYYQLQDAVLVHAGLNFFAADPFEDTKAMMTIRNFRVRPSLITYRPIIHGHTPTKLSDILKVIKGKLPMHFSIDAGCPYPNKKGMGHLLALCLDDLSYLIQPNVEIKSISTTLDQ